MNGKIRTRGDDLKEPQRQLLDLVRDRPGATFQYLADVLGCDHSTVRYHCKMLARRGFIEQHKSGRVVCNFLASHLNGVDWRMLQPMLREERQRRVIEHMVAKPGRQWTINRLATAVGLSHDSTLRICEKLESLDFIAKEQRPSGRYCITAHPRLAKALEKCLASEGGEDMVQISTRDPAQADAPHAGSVTAIEAAARRAP